MSEAVAGEQRRPGSVGAVPADHSASGTGQRDADRPGADEPATSRAEPGSGPPGGPWTGVRPSTCPPYPVITLAHRIGARTGQTPTATVTGVTLDSRTVHAHDLYVGLPGARTHGARFAAAAVAAGATAVLTDAAGAELIGDGLTADVLVVDDPRAAMARAAAEVYQRPADKMTMLGVTGTAGKTSTASLLAAGMAAAGRSCGLIGTLGYFLDGDQLDAERTTVTTPESPDLQALLAVFAKRGAQAVVMEVSSHALVLGRVDEICFDVAGFTNFGRDHLDFHGTEEAYFEAKAQLFTARRARGAVINGDDPRGVELLRRARATGLATSQVSLAIAPDGAEDEPAGHAYRCLAIDYATDPATIRMATPSGELEFALGLPGRYNVANAITALAILDQADISLTAAAPGLADAVVPGRLQRVDLGSSAPRTFVDFAHTPQAVESALTELARIRGDGKLIGVIGCGGDRDPEKRGPMGAAAADRSDVVLVTDDNPRSEDPAAIRQAVLAGARTAVENGQLRVTVIDGGDRRSAIRQAFRLATPDDVIAVLGKGHEPGQEIADQVLPFDDVTELQAGWQERAGDTADSGAPS